MLGGELEGNKAVRPDDDDDVNECVKILRNPTFPFRHSIGFVCPAWETSRQ